MVPAGGRANVTYPFSPSGRTMNATPAWYPATYQLRGRQPRGWATRLSPPAVIGAPQRRSAPHAQNPDGAPRALLRGTRRHLGRIDRGGQVGARVAADDPRPPLPARRG